MLRRSGLTRAQVARKLAIDPALVEQWEGQFGGAFAPETATPKRKRPKPKTVGGLRASAGVFVRRKPIANAAFRGRIRSLRTIAEQSGHPAPVVLAPNRYWSSGVFAVSTREGKLHLAVTMDVFSRRIIGWSTHRTRSAGLVLDALRAALEFRQPQHVFVHHIEHGKKYTGVRDPAILARVGGLAGLHQKGNRKESLMVRSFFGTLDREHTYEQNYRSHADAQASIAEFIAYYNVERIHSTLRYLTPIEFEARFADVQQVR